MTVNFNQKLTDLLKKDLRFVDDDSEELIRSEIVNEALKIDKKLIEALLSEKDIKEKFFTEIKGHWVFEINKFIDFIQDKNFLSDSYTKFKNKIGLNIDGKFLNERKEVSLVWPFKDCVLEGGMTKEDQKRNEIFFNEILAQDEIDRLLDPKVLTNFKRVTAKGEEKVTDFKRDKNGTIRENLIIKGNNLLALHSLKKEFQERVKLIYIDPPYNPDNKNNTFAYNNNFNHSTWLTFMKNRLQVAKTLLTFDGVLEIAIDKNEQPYLGVLLDEIFPEHEKHCVTIVHNPRGVQGTNFSYTHEFTYFVIPKGLKTIGNRKIEEEDVSWRNLRDNGGESLRNDARNCFYPMIIQNDEIIGFGDVPDNDFHPSSGTEKKGDKYYVWPIDKEGIERKWRYARQSVEKIKNLLRLKSNGNGFEIEIGKDFGMYRTVWIDKRYDSNENGTKLVKSLVPNCKFSFPKSLYNVYDCIYAAVAEDKNAIVLDYHAGSGTTAHALIDLNKEDDGNRNFILVEQMDYIESVTSKRVQKVIENYKLKDSFVFCELMKHNEEAVDKIESAKTTENLLKIWKEMVEHYFLNYDVDIKRFNDNQDEFKKLPLEKQKKLLVEMLNKNQLYVNLSEIDDAQFKVSKEDKELNKKFYK